MTPPRLSIVVPSFEQGPFLRESLHSILDQDWPNLEVIVIDGASKDESVSILEELSDELTFWVSEPDGGQSDAINKGFAHCTGDIVTFFSSDDCYLPGCFADAARLYQGNKDAGAFVGAFRFMDEAGVPEPHVHVPRFECAGSADLALTDPFDWRLHQVATFYNRTVLDRAGRWVRNDLTYTMDRELLYRVCRLAPPALSMRPWAHFRRHSESKSVAAILPFSAELGRLHLLDCPPGEPRSQRRLRKNLDRYHRMRGHLKYAKAVGPGLVAMNSLALAFATKPSLITKTSYIRSWVEALPFSAFREGAA